MIRCYIFGDDSTKQLISTCLSSLSPVFHSGMSNDYRTTFIEVARNKPDVVFVDTEVTIATTLEIIALKDISTVLTLTNIRQEAANQQLKNEQGLSGSVQSEDKQMPDEVGIACSDHEKKEMAIERGVTADSTVIKTTTRGLCGVISVSVNFSTIAYIKSDKNYLNIYLDDGTHHRAYMRLKVIKSILPAHFDYINKSFIINLNKITSTEGNDFVMLNNNPKNRISVGSSHKSKIAKWRKNNNVES